MVLYYRRLMILFYNGFTNKGIIKTGKPSQAVELINIDQTPIYSHLQILFIQNIESNAFDAVLADVFEIKIRILIKTIVFGG